MTALYDPFGTRRCPHCRVEYGTVEHVEACRKRSWVQPRQPHPFVSGRGTLCDAVVEDFDGSGYGCHLPQGHPFHVGVVA